MSDEDWGSGFGKSITVYLNGQGIPDLDPRGQRVTDDSFVMCFNAHHEPIDFTLPPKEFGSRWQPVIYTVDGAVMEGSRPVAAAAQLTVEARSVIVLQAAPEEA
jgi:isoamylase